FVSRQRLSELKQTVIPESEIDDPLIIDPIRLVAFDYNRGQLMLRFQLPVNTKWIWALHNMGSFQSVLGKQPERFSISVNTARIDAGENEVQQIINHFKNW